jgi:hypothetical protein
MVTTDMAYHNTFFGRLDLTFASFFFFSFFFLNHADEIDVSVHSLDDQLEEFTDKEISDFVSFDSSYTCL